jgi:hypothetical protein
VAVVEAISWEFFTVWNEHEHSGRPRGFRRLTGRSINQPGKEEQRTFTIMCDEVVVN